MAMDHGPWTIVPGRWTMVMAMGSPNLLVPAAYAHNRDAPITDKHPSSDKHGLSDKHPLLDNQSLLD